VLLNAAAPQVLGDAFLRAAGGTAAPCTLLFITSGAATSVYEGWSAYGAGKAAVDQWVRTAGAEQKRRGGRCRVLAVAPGVIATAMQEQIRAMTEEHFPVVERFRELHRAGALRDAADAARDLWALVVKDTFPERRRARSAGRLSRERMAVVRAARRARDRAVRSGARRVRHRRGGPARARALHGARLVPGVRGGLRRGAAAQVVTRRPRRAGSGATGATWA
jgi:hypothetical protein